MATEQATAKGVDPDRPVTPRSLVILGAGEHARVVAEAARSTEAWDSIAFNDAGEDDVLAARLDATPPDARPALVLGFGADAAARRRAVDRFDRSTTWATVVHARAWVSPTAQIEGGTVVLAGAIVSAGAIVGRHAIVNTSAVVEHDTSVGEFAHVAPGAVLGGGVVVGAGALVGLGALVRDHVTIGADAVIGMGSVVVHEIDAGRTVGGNPARPLPSSADG